MNTYANSLAVSGGYVYFANSDSVGRVDTASLQQTMLLAKAQNPRHLIIAGDLIYLSTSEPSGKTASIQSLPKAPGMATVITQGFDYVNALAVSCSTLYFTADDNVEKFTLRSVSLAGGTSAAALAHPVSTFAVDLRTLYFVPYDATRSFMASVDAAPLSDLSSGVGVAGLGVSGDGLLTHDANVYYCGQGEPALAGSCGSISKQDGTVTELASSAARLLLKVVDEQGLVLLETATTGDRLLQVPLAGGTPKVLATLQNTGDLAVATDTAHAYIGDFGAILRVDR